MNKPMQLAQPQNGLQREAKNASILPMVEPPCEGRTPRRRAHSPGLETRISYTTRRSAAPLPGRTSREAFWKQDEGYGGDSPIQPMRHVVPVSPSTTRRRKERAGYNPQGHRQEEEERDLREELGLNDSTRRRETQGHHQPQNLDSGRQETQRLDALQKKGKRKKRGIKVENQKVVNDLAAEGPTTDNDLPALTYRQARQFDILASSGGEDDNDSYDCDSDGSSQCQVPGAFTVSGGGANAANGNWRLTRQPTSHRSFSMISLPLSDDPLEAKMQEATVQAAAHGKHTRKNSRKTIMIIICCVLVVICATVGTVVGVLLSGNDDSSGASQTASPSRSPTMGPIPESERTIALREFLQPMSDPFVLSDTSTPQYHAMVWLADVDEANLGLEDNHSMDRLQVRYALASIYFATNGDEWIQTFGFLSGMHECEWHGEISASSNNTETMSNEPDSYLPQGVHCNGDGEVTSVNLRGNKLFGSIPNELILLTNLRHLNLASNTFRSSSYSDAQAGLESAATFTAIAELGGETLVSLDLSDNQFGTSFPLELMGLTNLEILRLQHNALTSTIPERLSQLSNLKELNLEGNALVGSLDDVVRDLANLEILAAHRNDFQISPHASFPTSLRVLNLGRNNFGSTLSRNIGRLTNLQTLNLERMNLIGSVPEEIGRMTALVTLILEGNLELSGTFPWSSLSASTLRILQAQSCGFSGELPSDIGRFTVLEFLDLESNFLEGSIPTSVGDMISLDAILLGSNLLEGTIPSTVGGMESLFVLDAKNNFLTGTIPTELMSLNNLVLVRIQGNDITGGNIEFLCNRITQFGVSEVDCDTYEDIICSCCECS